MHLKLSVILHLLCDAFQGHFIRADIADAGSHSQDSVFSIASPSLGLLPHC